MLGIYESETCLYCLSYNQQTLACTEIIARIQQYSVYKCLKNPQTMSTNYPLSYFVRVPITEVSKERIEESFKNDNPGIKFEIKEEATTFLVQAQAGFVM